MKPHEVIQKINEGWGFRLPGERSLYWSPRHRVPEGHIELFTTGKGRITWYLVRVPPDIVEEARRLQEARQAALEDLRYPEERP